MGIKKNMKRKIKKALISLSDKSNLKSVLKILKKFNIKIISSGGTSKEIKKLGFNYTEISKFTKSSEILDGRVKSLHPKIYAGILSKRDSKKHYKELKNKLRIPISDKTRSLNVVVAASISAAEALRQIKIF